MHFIGYVFPFLLTGSPQYKLPAKDSTTITLPVSPSSSAGSQEDCCEPSSPLGIVIEAIRAREVRWAISDETSALLNEVIATQQGQTLGDPAIDAWADQLSSDMSQLRD